MASVAVLVALAAGGCGGGAPAQPLDAAARAAAAEAGAGGGSAPAAGAPSSSGGPAQHGSGGPGSGAAAAAAGGRATPWPTQVPFATPQSPGGHATVHAGGAGFTETGSTCAAARDEVLFSFGTPGSGEEVTVVIHSGYRGPGTYSAPSADASVSASHQGRTWYAQFSSSSGASITVDGDGRSGSFAYIDQVGSGERVTGMFACG
jgi:hypothetical protein